MKRFSLRLEKDLHEKLRKESFDTGESINEIITKLIKNKYKEDIEMKRFKIKITRNGQTWIEEIQAENGDNACYKALEPYAKKMGGKVVHGIQGIGVESPVVGSWPTQYKISYWATCLK